MELQGKPDLEQAMKRIDAWSAHEMIDRPPVRFAEHNADFAAAHTLRGPTWPDLRSRWFDAEFQLDYFLESIRGRTFHGETFPGGLTGRDFQQALRGKTRSGTVPAPA